MRAEILAGHVSEPKTLKSALAPLRGRKPTVIMDAGVATQANLAYLKAQKRDWICVERAKKPPAPTSEPEDELTTRARTVVKAWRLSDKNSDELRVYLQSKARTGDRLLKTQRQRFETALDELHAGLSQPN